MAEMLSAKISNDTVREIIRAVPNDPHLFVNVAGCVVTNLVCHVMKKVLKDQEECAIFFQALIDNCAANMPDMFEIVYSPDVGEGVH